MAWDPVEAAQVLVGAKPAGLAQWAHDAKVKVATDTLRAAHREGQAEIVDRVHRWVVAHARTGERFETVVDAEALLAALGEE